MAIESSASMPVAYIVRRVQTTGADPGISYKKKRGGGTQ